jgi:two-component system response regulator AtoC
MRRVLVANDDDSARQTLQVKLRSEGYETIGVASIEAARRELAADRFHFAVVGPSIWRAAGQRVGDAATGLASPAGASPAWIALLPAGSAAAAGLVAIAGGAQDFVVEGDGDQVADGVVLALKKAEARAAQRPGANAAERATRAGAAASLPLVGKSPPMLALAEAIRKVAPFKATALLQGESGTGKELIARALHDLSPRADGPFVAVNCGAIPAGLMESELLGHCKGAFTDALRDRAGLLEQASGGTLFLDEIGELPLDLQPKLLRVLQDARVRRLGDAEERPVDVRLVAATARDLEAEVAAGRFREDLFHRINVVGLRVPPLRERGGDIPLLIEHFLARINRRFGLHLAGVSPEALRALTAYAWPGNVRELENTVERAAVMGEGGRQGEGGGGEIDLASLPERILHGPGGVAPVPVAGATGAGRGSPGEDGDLSIKRAARRSEEDLIRRALAQTGGNRTRAAELLEISHRALLYKIKEYGVSLPMSPGGAEEASKDVKF